MNFRSTFTPSKQFTFSLQQLQFLKTKCAQFLTTIISKIHSHPEPVSKTVKKRTKYVCLPDLFGPVDMRYTVLPLSYHSSVEPEEGCRCDISSCQVENDAEPWELFEGCGHSFHNICLQETGCPLCKQFLSQKVQELGSVARDAILHPEDKDITDINLNPEIPNIDDDDNDSCNNTPECSTFKSTSPSNLRELKETINKLNSAISSLGQAKQPLLHHRPSNTSKPRQAKKKNNTATSTTKNVCIATSQQPCQTAAATECPKNVKKTMSKAQSNASNNGQNNMATIVRTDQGSITIYTLPPAICQTRVFGVTTASNACTIISTLCVRAFLLSTLTVPFSSDELTNAVNKYEKIIQTGNILYQQLHLPPGQPNLEVRQVINKIQDLNMLITEDVGYFHVEEFIKKMDNLLDSNTRQAGVLIVPAARSYAVLIDQGKIALFDSHQHGVYGGMIYVSKSRHSREFIAYLSQQESLCGCNFALLSLSK